jgi:hypothetical protein
VSSDPAGLATSHKLHEELDDYPAKDEEDAEPSNGSQHDLEVAFAYCLGNQSRSSSKKGVRTSAVHKTLGFLQYNDEHANDK